MIVSVTLSLNQTRKYSKHWTFLTINNSMCSKSIQYLKHKFRAIMPHTCLQSKVSKPNQVTSLSIHSIKTKQKIEIKTERKCIEVKIIFQWWISCFTSCMVSSYYFVGHVLKVEIYYPWLQFCKISSSKYHSSLGTLGKVVWVGLACVEQAKEQLIELCAKVTKSSKLLKGIGHEHFSLC